MSDAPKFLVHAPGTPQTGVVGDGQPETMIPTGAVTHAEGTATIKQDENVCIVQHGLGATPNSIKLDGIDEQKYFSYIVEVDDKQFQVNLHVPAEQDLTFGWTADL